jgi:hypothetical protein
MRLTTGSMLQVARDLRIDDHLAAERQRRAVVTPDQLPAGARSSIHAGRSDRPTGLRRLISFGLHA